MAATLASGARFGVHEVVALIGVGGMGEVCRAHDTTVHLGVAIKRQRHPVSGDLTWRRTLYSCSRRPRGRLLKIENQASLIYLRHSTNAWKFDAGSYMDPAGWRPSGTPAGFTRERLDAYAAEASLLCG
jgi:hypothetical protein